MEASKGARYYDPVDDRLLYVAQSATPEYWDSHWKKTIRGILNNPPPHRYTVWLTQKYLPVGSVLLEGGCGVGDKVYAFDKAGFIAKGIDFAPEVVALARQHWPHLNIKEGDVRKLDVESGSIDGYWSLGVIEHFFDGYAEIAVEIERVLRPGGYLFLTFPMLNRVRSNRARRGKIPSVKSANRHDIVANFYQYALNPDQVLEDFRRLGFVLRYRGGLSTLDCLSGEVRFLHRIISLMRFLPFGIYAKLGLLIDMVFGKYWGHVAILVLQKK